MDLTLTENGLYKSKVIANDFEDSDFSNIVPFGVLSVVSVDLSTLGLSSGSHTMSIVLSDDSNSHRDSEKSNEITFIV